MFQTKDFLATFNHTSSSETQGQTVGSGGCQMNKSSAIKKFKFTRTKLLFTTLLSIWLPLSWLSAPGSRRITTPKIWYSWSWVLIQSNTNWYIWFTFNRPSVNPQSTLNRPPIDSQLILNFNFNFTLFRTYSFEITQSTLDRHLIDILNETWLRVN